MTNIQQKYTENTNYRTKSIPIELILVFTCLYGIAFVLCLPASNVNLNIFVGFYFAIHFYVDTMIVNLNTLQIID